MKLSSFSQLLSEVKPAPTLGNGVYQAKITRDWLQGRATFGGLVSALADAALRQELAKLSHANHITTDLSLRPLRSMMTAFIGPAGEGELEIHCTMLRSGKSVTWTEAKVIQNGQLCTTITSAYGGSRSSTISVTAGARPVCKSAEDSEPMIFIDGITPNFTQHFDMRWAIGEMPFKGSDNPEMGVWVKFLNESKFSEPHLVAMMDVLPPAVLPMFREMKPISSLSWHLELTDELTSADTQDAKGWWFFHVRADAAADGYSQQHATLFTPAGKAIAYSRQTVAVFA